MRADAGDSIDPDVLTIGGVEVGRGERTQMLLDGAALYDYTRLNIPVEVIRGRERGPVLFISAAVHGDEINGVEIVRRLRRKRLLGRIKGTLILIPVVNVFGFNIKSRYLPDGRDLNRSFPGKKGGSLASRLARVFMKEIVTKCTHGIDLHTGTAHRTNLPHVRASLDDEDTRALAEGFGVPVVINSNLRDGSLREAGRKKGVSMLLFEGGEALRFEDRVIKAGLSGCVSVMKRIGMVPDPHVPTKGRKRSPKVFVAESSYWVRAPRSGVSSATKRIGDVVEEGELLATIADPMGDHGCEVRARAGGILMGASLLPLVNQGDAMFHVATFRSSSSVRAALDLHDAASSE